MDNSYVCRNHPGSNDTVFRRKTGAGLHRPSFNPTSGDHQRQLLARKLWHRRSDKPGDHKAPNPSRTAEHAIALQSVDSSDLRVGDSPEPTGRKPHRVRRFAVVRYSTSAVARYKENRTLDWSRTYLCVSNRDLPKCWSGRMAGWPCVRRGLCGCSGVAGRLHCTEPDFFRLHITKPPTSKHLADSTGLRLAPVG